MMSRADEYRLTDALLIGTGGCIAMTDSMPPLPKRTQLHFGVSTDAEAQELSAAIEDFSLTTVRPNFRLLR
jgi:hypothetical protein